MNTIPTGSSDLFSALFQNSKVNAFIQMDTAGYITAINPAFKTYFGYSDADVMGKHFSMFFTEDCPIFAMKRLPILDPGRSIAIEVLFLMRTNCSREFGPECYASFISKKYSSLQGSDRLSHSQQKRFHKIAARQA